MPDAQSSPATQPTTPNQAAAPATTIARNNTPAAPATVQADNSFSGDWKMVVSVSEALNPDGQRETATGTHEIGLFLKIEGSRVTGDYTWAKGVCAIAHLEGTMIGPGNFEGIVSYNGGCCGGSKMKLVGNFTSPENFTAKFKPEGRPAAWCKTWWATIQGIKE